MNTYKLLRLCGRKAPVEEVVPSIVVPHERWGRVDDNLFRMNRFQRLFGVTFSLIHYFHGSFVIQIHVIMKRGRPIFVRSIFFVIWAKTSEYQSANDDFLKEDPEPNNSIQIEAYSQHTSEFDAVASDRDKKSRWLVSSYCKLLYAYDVLHCLNGFSIPFLRIQILANH